MAGALNAAPIAYEGFGYGDGVNLTTETANNGTGWTDAWATTGVDGLVTSGSAMSLSFGQSPDLITDGSTHVWSESSKGNERDLTTSIPLGSQTLYFTALVRAYGGGASSADLRLGFFSGAGATGNMRANVGISDGTLFAAADTDGYGVGATAAVPASASTNCASPPTGTARSMAWCSPFRPTIRCSTSMKPPPLRTSRLAMSLATRLVV